MITCEACGERPATIYFKVGPHGEKMVMPLVPGMPKDLLTGGQALCDACAATKGIPIEDLRKKGGMDIGKMIQGLLRQMSPEQENDDIDGGQTMDPDQLMEGLQGMLNAMGIQGIQINGMEVSNAAEGTEDAADEEETPEDAAADAKNNKQAKKMRNKKLKHLPVYCINLTERAAEKKLDRIIGREKELARMIQILTRRQKNNPCLIGEPGVGKTAIAEALAQRIVAGEVPYRLQNKTVWLLDMTAIVAGTQFRGQFEARMKGLIEEVRALGNVILVIDEVHTIVGAGDAEGSMNAANILKPALSRGEIQVIGATTLAEYRKYIEKDAALERRFQPVMVEEPTVEATVGILEGIAGYYEKHHRIKVPREILRKAAILSERYITDRYLPDKAIDLLDEAAAYAAMHAPALERLQKAEYELAAAELAVRQAEKEIENCSPEESTACFRARAEAQAVHARAKGEVDTLRVACDALCVTLSDIAAVIEIWTGVPATSITEHEFRRIDGLADRIKTRIIGQDQAVDAVARAIKRNRAGVSSKRKPVSFIFAGPTGVGKTELVKVLAADLFDSPETLIRLDMSEFMEKHSVSRIIGAPPGYVGYDDGGQLTEKIRRKPYSVVLFDEIEKAHPDVMNILLQILDDGRVTDAHGKTVDFCNTLIVMTTNAGSNRAMNIAGFGGAFDSQAEDRTQKALEEFLRPEFLNRVDAIITFRSLGEEDFARIAHIMLGDLAKVLTEKEITFTFTDAAAAWVAKKSYSHKYGARNMRRLIETEVEDRIADYLIANYETPPKTIAMDATPDAIAPDLTFLVAPKTTRRTRKKTES